MTDSRIQVIVGNLLRVGVVTAAAVVLAGGVWYLAANDEAKPDFHNFQPQHGVMAWTHGLAVIQVGLLLLIATPVARVVFSLAAFALERDRVYVAVTLVVLVILAYSLAMS